MSKKEKKLELPYMLLIPIIAEYLLSMFDKSVKHCPAYLVGCNSASEKQENLGLKQ